MVRCGGGGWAGKTTAFWVIGLRSQWAYPIINDKIYLSVCGHISGATHVDNTQNDPTTLPTLPPPTIPDTHCSPLLAPTISLVEHSLDYIQYQNLFYQHNEIFPLSWI